eukprot:NODE_6_length_70510_cov_1.054395.p23 type:complete len:374 gc:universal NODE_6_length_70510_cov_1.054395:65720-64599(-)
MFFLPIFATEVLTIYPNVEIYKPNDAVGLMFEFNDIQSTQISDIMTKLNVSELQLQFGKGLSPKLDRNWMNNISPVGANILVNSKTSLKQIYSVLSGIFCASLTSIESVNKFGNYFHGRLPQEAVCTENLTPFIKLLPCSKRMGLAELLNPLALFDGYYYSMSLKSTLKNGSYVTNIFFQSILRKEQHKTLNSLLKLEISGIETCPPLALNIKYEPFKPFDVKSRLKDGVFLLENIDVSPISELSKMETYHNFVSSSWLGGFGDDSGKLITVLRNNNDFPLALEYYEQIPWYFRLYLHTSKWKLSSGNETFLENFLFLPSKDRIQPAVLHYFLKVPAKSELTFSIEFEKGFLRYKEYKPDAHRGLDFGYIVLT